ncbi:MAG: type II toxin-antitoxin system HicB family antitoxin [Chloroflexota bacterium]|nr:type II toxin-antitoxin system HicB family antitoxin [Chloroflexota bacterium]MDE2919081.1 type II toxin-antitoxin system HicB family antitoxin [Chloroflexota bacterium]
MQFPIVIHKDEASSYGVTVPDLPGCFSGGDSFEDAMSSAHEAVACHIEGLLMDGESIPERQSIDLHQSNRDFENGVWALIDVDISKLSSTTVRVNITMPSRVLSIIDEAAARERESRSGLLARAALQFVDRQTTV